VELRERYGSWALVAGASEGIGESWCRRLAERGLNVVLVARREAPLRATAAELESRFGVQTLVLPLDLASPDLIDRVAEATASLDIGLLVYNAAHADVSEYASQSIESKLLTIDVNCRGLVLLTSYVAERLIARGRGAMVLMSSMSGWQGSAMMGTYAASKAFITVLGESLWSELRPLGVDVHVCVAGATRTPSYNAQTPIEKQRMTFPMEPDAVVDEMLQRLGGGPTVIVGRMNRVVHVLLGKLLPRTAAVRFFSRTMRDLYGNPR
jgi:short-subunit dehydrogenase